MSFELEQAKRNWNREVDAETARLIDEGVPPHKAATRAESIVSMRRQQRVMRDRILGRENGA